MDYSLMNYFLLISCEKCGKKDKEMFLCSRCLYTSYCSKDCQINDWKFHRTSCKTTKKQAEDLVTKLMKGKNVCNFIHAIALQINDKLNSNTTIDIELQNDSENISCCARSTDEKVVFLNNMIGVIFQVRIKSKVEEIFKELNRFQCLLIQAQVQKEMKDLIIKNLQFPLHFQIDQFGHGTFNHNWRTYTI